jgi:hypothetical protein
VKFKVGGKVGGHTMRPMVGRLLRNLFAALLVVALIAVPAFALQGSGLLGGPQAPAAPQADPQSDPEPPAVTTDNEDDGVGRCHGIQRAYWAVTGNPGKGEGKEEAAAALVAEANERGCELADAPAGWPGGRPDWAGGPPPWAGEGRGEGEGGPPWAEGDGPPWGPPPWAGEGRGERGAGNGEGRKGPPWATDDDGPPWGMAWGYWLSHEDLGAVCARIAARLEAHPNATVPEDLRERIESELGCNLP